MGLPSGCMLVLAERMLAAPTKAYAPRLAVDLPRGFGVRQSSGAFRFSRHIRKRQSTAAVQEAGAWLEGPSKPDQPGKARGTTSLTRKTDAPQAFHSQASQRHEPPACTASVNRIHTNSSIRLPRFWHHHGQSERPPGATA